MISMKKYFVFGFLWSCAVLVLRLTLSYLCTKFLGIVGILISMLITPEPLFASGYSGDILFVLTNLLLGYFLAAICMYMNAYMKNSQTLLDEESIL